MAKKGATLIPCDRQGGSLHGETGKTGNKNSMDVKVAAIFLCSNRYVAGASYGAAL